MQAASEFGSHLPQLRLHPLANRLSQQEEAWVGFFTNDFLKKVALAGGPPVTLCAVGILNGASWGPDDTIVFASSLHPGLMQVPAAGGEPLGDRSRRGHCP